MEVNIMDNVVVVVVVDKNIFFSSRNVGFVIDVFDFFGVVMIEDFGLVWFGFYFGLVWFGLYFPCLLFCCFIEIRIVFFFVKSKNKICYNAA